NMHVPPFNSGLDLAPELGDDLSLRGGATSNMKPVGSTAVADAITKYKPVLTLHGHVHESRGSARIGDSVALNPGSEYNAGVLRGVLVRLDGDRVASHQFVSA
ncbi:MAG: metallophosphoesterase, partial [Gemmatimonadota bacterium]|nr:metallophosphoesterase [Gemmatimonadota bacterium]